MTRTPARYQPACTNWFIITQRCGFRGDLARAAPAGPNVRHAGKCSAEKPSCIVAKRPRLRRIIDFRLQIELPPTHVEPLAELVAHPLINRDRSETQPIHANGRWPRWAT